ncbi:nicotinamide riboside transporter PnuC [Gammaproteobacteria bacterium]|nr:nicotinamide riboside transporter PnuC [Gammaproteobacteria bacterium]
MISNFIIQNLLEITAIIFAILYLLLAVKQNIMCWPAAIISSVLYFFIMEAAGLYMEAYLQVFYVAMGIYGWSRWRRSAINNTNFVVNTWSKYQHMIAISIILALSLLSGFLLERYTDAALPFFDALATWGAVIATYMVAKQLLENWIYWFVVDATSIFLFISRDLWLTAALFMIYIVIIYFGYQSWSKIRCEINGSNI